VSGSLAGIFSTGRLLRYGVTGLLSAATHMGVLVLLVEYASWRPIWASTVGFVASVAVSYLLQRSWVFESSTPIRTSFPRFTIVALVALGLNTVILAVGTEFMSAYYVVVQAVALIAIPVSNYILNSLWTFRA
jgi:putative flippase GtrA